jgi:hypothetical protein
MSTQESRGAAVGTPVGEGPARHPDHEAPGAAPPRTGGSRGQAAAPERAATTAVGAVVVLAVVVGVVLRAWYIAHDVINSDEAIVGLMAHQILHGHFYTFYWGQSYGGAEPYVTAAVFAVVGQSGVTMQISATLLWVVAAVLTWRVALRLVADRRLAALAAALVWVAPEVGLYNSTLQYGFRNVTLVAGLACLLLALRLLDAHRGPLQWAGLGLAAGVGWWSSPEIAYFLVPAALIALGVLVRRGAGRLVASSAGLALAAVGFVVGALPWIYTNARTNLASLDLSNFNQGSTLTYRGRLGVFEHFAGPIELDLRDRITGDWLVGSAGTPGWEHLAKLLLVAAVAVALVAAFVLCLAQLGRAVALAVSVAAFPFIYADSPATWYWQDGRYAVFLGPLVALMLVAGLSEAARRLAGRRAGAARGGAVAPARRKRASWPAVTMSGVVVVSALFTVVTFHRINSVGAGSFADGWGNPDSANERAVAALEAHGLDHGYADYWVAYNLDFLGQGRLDYTTIANDTDRSAAINRAARRGTGQAWLFQAPWGGPAGLPEAQLLAALRSHRVAYRLVTAGPVTAVVPAGHVTPATFGYDKRYASS